MRPLPFSALALAAALLVPSVASAQSSTPILGFYKFTAPVGNTAWIGGLVTKTDFQSKPASVTSGTPNSIINQTTPGTAWTPGTTFPLHYVEFLDDPATGAVEPWTGLVLDIVSNTDTTLTVKGTLSAFAGLGSTPLYCIRKHATLGTLFANGAGLVPFTDIVTLYKSNGGLVASVYDNGGGQFVSTADFFTPTSDTVVYPGQGWVLTIAGPSGTEVTIGGGEVAYVKSTPTKVPLYKTPVGVINLLGPVTPLVVTNPGDPLFPTRTIPMSQTGILGSGFEPFGDLLTVLRTDGSILTSGLYQIGDLGSGTVVLNGNFVESNNDPFIRGQAFSVTVANTEKYFTLPVVHPIN